MFDAGIFQEARGILLTAFATLYPPAYSFELNETPLTLRTLLMNKDSNQTLLRGKSSIVPWYLLVGFGDSKGYAHGLYIRAIETFFEDFDAMLHPKTAIESDEVDLEPFMKTYKTIIDIFQVSWLKASTFLSR